jgi:hypothetical protein
MTSGCIRFVLAFAKVMDPRVKPTGEGLADQISQNRL